MRTQLWQSILLSRWETSELSHAANPSKKIDQFHNLSPKDVIFFGPCTNLFLVSQPITIL